jgi:lipoprotein signal peptidase
LVDQLSKSYIAKIFSFPISMDGSVFSNKDGMQRISIIDWNFGSNKIEESLDVHTPLFSLSRTDNPHLAFGINIGDNFDIIINIFTIALTCLIIYFLYKSAKEYAGTFKCISFSMILGGAFGNLYDRLTDGAVVDFINLNPMGFFPFTFNLADSFITIGMILILFSDFFIYRKSKNELPNS